MAIKPKAPFRAVFQVATTREGSGVALVHERAGESGEINRPPPGGYGAEAEPCSWWRRGREPVSEVRAIEVMRGRMIE